MDKLTRIVIVAALIVPLLLASGCEDSAVLAPANGQIVLTANPAAIQLDPDGIPPVVEGTTTITAQIFDSEGRPISGAVILFTTTGGVLASTPSPGNPPIEKETDENGVASDLLTINEDDPDSVDVTASSGTLVQSVTVAKSEIERNDPVADLIAVPPDQQDIGQSVTFDGTGSFDPEGDDITCYQWQITADPADILAISELPCIPDLSNCTIIQGPSESVITRSFGVDQFLSVVLRVSDLEGLACNRFGPPAPGTAFGPDAATLSYRICDATPPTAVIAGNDVVESIGVNPNVAVTFDGTGSFDDESNIEFYNWSCGNGTQPTGQGTPVATCRYTEVDVYTASLTVENECGKTGTTTISVTIDP